MIENQKFRPAQVIGPLGEPLTLDSLPPPGTTRWVVRRKAEVVAAVNFCIQAMSYDSQHLLEHRTSWLQVKSFVDAAVHIGARLIDYIDENFPQSRDSCGAAEQSVQVYRS